MAYFHRKLFSLTKHAKFSLGSSGYILKEAVFSSKQCTDMNNVLSDVCSENTYKIRDVLRKIPELLPLIHKQLRSLLGPTQIVRSVLFRKPASNNWKVPWHQDVCTQVNTQLDLLDYGPWSTKENVIHVQPPVHIMQSMLSCRIHLSPCQANDGPLRVIAGSHRKGYIPFKGLSDFDCAGSTPIICNRGDVLFFSPLLLHSSTPVTSTADRCVLHLELTNHSFDNGLTWAWTYSL